MTQNSTQPQLLEELRQHVRRLEGTKPPVDDTLLSTGCQPLDDWLPDHGWRRGCVLEWLSPGSGSGAGWLALVTARQALRGGGVLVLVEQTPTIYPPALAHLGFDLTRVVLVRAQNRSEQRWAIDQALRSPAVALVWSRLDKVDDKTSRRFQLAAETGGALGLFVRPSLIRGQPTWADLQLAVEPLPTGEQRSWRLELLRARGPTAQHRLALQWDDLTGTLRAGRHHETHPVSVARA